MIKKLFFTIIFFSFLKSNIWNDVEKGFLIKKSSELKYDAKKLYELLTEFEDFNLKLSFFIKILTINFEIEVNGELAVNYYQSLYKKKDTMSVRLDAKSYINLNNYTLLNNSVVDRDDLESDVKINITEYENLINENVKLEKLFFDFLGIENNQDRFLNLAEVFADFILNYDEIQYTDIIYLIYLFMDRNQHLILFKHGREQIIDDNDIKINKEEYGIKLIRSYYIDKLKGKKIDEEDKILVDYFRKRFRSNGILWMLKFFKPFISKVKENDFLKAQKILMLLIYVYYTQFVSNINDFHWIIDYNNSKSTLISDFNKSDFDIDIWYPKLEELLLDGIITHSLYNMYYFDDFTKKSTKVGKVIKKITFVSKIIIGLLIPYFSILFGGLEIFDHYYNQYTTLYNYSESDYQDLKIDNLKNRLVGCSTLNIVAELKRMTIITQNYSDSYFESLFYQLNSNFQIKKKEIKGSILLIPRTKTYVTFTPRKLDIMAVAKNWTGIEKDIRENWIQTIELI